MTVPVTFTDPVGSDGNPPLVLGPSLGTSTSLWSRAMPALAETYRVMAWDLPGHGVAPPATVAFTVEDLADAVAAGMRARIDGPVLYAGVSLGGAVGLELALRNPDLIAASAVVASGAQLGDAALWRERAGVARSRSTSALVEGSAQRWFAPGSWQQDHEFERRLLAGLELVDDESYALCCEALEVWDIRDRLGGIAPPIVMIWGEYDAVAPEAKALEVAQGVRDGRARMIAGAAHLPPADNPAAVAETLQSFFATTHGAR